MEENITEYRALLIDENNKKFNGVAIFEEDGLVLEKRSRLNGKVKDAFKVKYDEITEGNVQRLADNKIQISLADKTLLLKTLDDDMLNDFESRLINKLTTGSFETIEEAPANQMVRDIPEEIRKYHELLKDGIITEEEFEEKKKELLKI